MVRIRFGPNQLAPWRGTLTFVVVERPDAAHIGLETLLSPCSQALLRVRPREMQGSRFRYFTV